MKKLSERIDCGMVILGNGPLKESLESCIANLGLQSRVQLLGFNENPYKIINNCDMLLSTSTAEGQPNAILEAVALSKPVVALDCPTGPKEILATYKAGELVEVDSVPLYISAINKVVSNGLKVDDASVEALKSDFASEKIVKAYLEIFEGVVSC